ncbi:MAG: DUF192 domain-containing protein [Bdellovibrionales bacterium]|nr:DUF192 domain-containing protein [Bdellovibrionales bacterium]NQZ18823.1 DUF192 domain-containing protein [Bdellovibrionales bacterium]
MLNLLLILFVSFQSQGLEFKKQKLRFENGKTLEVEVAESHEQRAQGLMNRTSLGENKGMLFIFDFPQHLSFWMKDTFIPLSIAYFDKEKSLKETYDMKEQNMMEKVQDTRGYPSQCQCVYALEVNQGWFQKNNIKKGMKFQLIPKSK